jgi:hypothetical protein
METTARHAIGALHATLSLDDIRRRQTSAPERRATFSSTDEAKSSEGEHTPHARVMGGAVRRRCYRSRRCSDASGFGANPISLNGRPQIRITRRVKYARLPNNVPTATRVTE